MCLDSSLRDQNLATDFEITGEKTPASISASTMGLASPLSLAFSVDCLIAMMRSSGSVMSVCSEANTEPTWLFSSVVPRRVRMFRGMAAASEPSAGASPLAVQIALQRAADDTECDVIHSDTDGVLDVLEALQWEIPPRQIHGAGQPACSGWF